MIHPLGQRINTDYHNWYLLYDEFTTARLAGAAHNTEAEPKGGLRYVVDTNGKLSIINGVASFATGGVGIGDPGLWYRGFVRRAGLTFRGTIIGTLTNYSFGWDSNLTSTIYHGLNILSAGNARLFITDGALLLIVGGTPSSGQSAQIASVLRASGCFHFQKNANAYPNWSLMYPDNLGTVTPVYPAVQARTSTSVFTAGNLAIGFATITPLASDAFARADGPMGVTGGGGSEESGGLSKTWVDQLGTWGVSTSKAACSALAGGLGITTVDCGTPHIIVEAVCTRVAGNVGFSLRYTDANNYIRVILDGTNLQVIETVGGTPNTLINSAVTYGATKRLIISLNATKVRAYYGNTLIGAESTTAVVTGNNHGFYTSDIGATFDNFVVWAKGNGGEYE